MFNRDTGFASLKMIFQGDNCLPKRQEPLSTLIVNHIPCLPQRECLTGRLALTEYLELTYGVLVGEGRSRAGRQESQQINRTTLG